MYYKENSPSFVPGSNTALDAPVGKVSAQLISKFGHSLTILQESSAYYDPASRIASQTSPAVKHSIRGIPIEVTAKEIQSGLVKVGDRKIMIAARSLSFEIGLNDKVLFEGVKHNIINVEPIYSGELPAVITLQLRK